jgi:nucleotide-binding universal stress UspA family protein
MKTIIAPTDFTASSISAVNYAADLSVALNAKLILLNLVQVPMVAAEIPVAETVFEDMVSMAEKDLDNIVLQLTARTKGVIDIEKKILMGTVAAGIKEISDLYKPFAIVMGIKPGKSIDRILLGSSTLSSVKHNSYPVLIIPENVRFKGIHKIGLACDLQNVLETVPFHLLNEWMSVFNPALDIIHISKNEHDFKSPDIGESISLQNHLSKFKPSFHFITGTNLSVRLNDYAMQQNLDLLIVFPRKHGFLSIFDKKHSNEIVVNNKIAVLAMHNY